MTSFSSRTLPIKFQTLICALALPWGKYLQKRALRFLRSPRGAGNTRALSCGGTHSRKAGNTGASRKCRATACTKKILNEYWQLGTSMGPSLGIGNFYARYYRLAPLSPIRLLRRHLPIQDRCPAACFLYESVTLCTCSAVYKNCAAPFCCYATSGA